MDGAPSRNERGADGLGRACRLDGRRRVADAGTMDKGTAMLTVRQEWGRKCYYRSSEKIIKESRYEQGKLCEWF
ncbi:hypothetical protein EJB05_16559, partial [Eragrostis curvula]